VDEFSGLDSQDDLSDLDVIGGEISSDKGHSYLMDEEDIPDYHRASQSHAANMDSIPRISNPTSIGFYDWDDPFKNDFHRNSAQANFFNVPEISRTGMNDWPQQAGNSANQQPTLPIAAVPALRLPFAAPAHPTGTMQPQFDIASLHSRTKEAMMTALKTTFLEMNAKDEGKPVAEKTPATRFVGHGIAISDLMNDEPSSAKGPAIGAAPSSAMKSHIETVNKKRKADELEVEDELLEEVVGAPSGIQAPTEELIATNSASVQSISPRPSKKPRLLSTIAAASVATLGIGFSILMSPLGQALEAF